MTTITYIAGAYYTDSDNTSTVTTDDSIITIAGPIFSMAGYEIKEWNTQEDGSGTTYALGSAYSGGDITLYGIWQLSNANALKISNVMNGTIETLDISNVLQGVTVWYGKNQPFAYISLEVLKSAFNDPSYWEDRRQHDLSSSTYGNYTFPPQLDQVGTTFTLDVYSITGTWLYERVEDAGEFNYKIICVCPAYFMKKTTLQTAFNFSGASPYTFFNIPSAFTKTVTSGTTVDKVSFNIGTNPSIDVYINHSATPYIDRIEADGGELFRLLAMMIGGYSDDDVVIDAGYMPFTGSSYSDYTIKDNYTVSEIETLKQNRYSLSGYQECHADVITLRPDEFCWDVINSIGALSNRTPFFCDKAYFVDYVTLNNPNIEHVSKFKLNWGGDDSVDEDGYFNPEFNSISVNQDQGSEYVLSSQKVIAEGYEYEIVVSDAPTTNSGKDIKFLARENVTTSQSSGQPPTYTFNTKTRNFQTQLIALNTLLRWYKPQDSVQYSIQETIKPNRTVTVYPTSSFSAQYDGEIIAYEDNDTLITIYFRGQIISQSNTNWTRVSDLELGRERAGGYSAYAVCDEIYDVQNNIQLYDVPLAQTVLTYPQMITEYTWGEPYFIDEENAFSSLQGIAQDTTLDNTADMSISNNYAAKIVVGNQKLADLQDDRANFSGLILEKNWDADLYRLSGWNNGDLQTYLNSQGEFMSGDQTSPNKVIINRNGLTIGGAQPITYSVWSATDTYNTGDIVLLNGTLYMSLQDNNTNHNPSSTTGYWLDLSTAPPESGILPWESGKEYAVNDFVTYSNSIYRCTTAHTSGSSWDSSKWTAITTYTSTLSGTIYASQNNIIGGTGNSSAGTVRINSSGLTTYNSSGTAQCYVGADTGGTISAGGGRVKLNSSGLITYNSSGTAQCYVGADTGGTISAGGGRVKIDSSGLTTYNSSGTPQCYVGTDTNGTISAGGGNAKLDSNGIRLIATSGEPTTSSVLFVPNSSITDMSKASRIYSKYITGSTDTVGYLEIDVPNSGLNSKTVCGISMTAGSNTYPRRMFAVTNQTGNSIDVTDVTSSSSYDYLHIPLVKEGVASNTSGSVTTIGYYRTHTSAGITGGFKDQFGYTSSVGYDEDITIIFPTSFSNTTYTVNLTVLNSNTTDSMTVFVTQRNTSSMGVHIRRNENASAGTRYILWHAVGF